MDLTRLRDRAVILRARGDLEGALDAYAQALAATPADAELRAELSRGLSDLGLERLHAPDEARVLFARAIEHDARNADALYGLGVVALEAGDVVGATERFEQTVRVAPRHAEAQNNLGLLASTQGDTARAEAHYIAALVAKPGFPEALNNLAVTDLARGRTAEAIGLLEAAVMHAPDHMLSQRNLGVARFVAGELEDALASFEACLAASPGDSIAAHERVVVFDHLVPAEDPLSRRVFRAWGDALSAATPLLPASPRKRDSDSPLVVGYLVSDDDGAAFLAAPLRAHDPARFRIHVYADASADDVTIERLRVLAASGGHHLCEVTHLSDDALAALIRHDEVDVLVETSGHGRANRLVCLARKPAPVQISWIGAPHGTGLDRIDFVLAGKGTRIPETRSGETVTLPGCVVSYLPCPQAPGVTALPARTRGFVTFGCFEGLERITRDVLGVWSHLLLVAPDARLLIVSEGLASAASRARVLARLTSAGLDPARVELVQRPHPRELLAMYAHVDIALATWPSARARDVCDAMLMGVPTVALRGAGASLVPSILESAPFSRGWTADDEHAYVARAAQMATDLDALDTLRGMLRDDLLRTPLCDTEKFVAELEHTYRMLVESNRGPRADIRVGATPLSESPLWEAQRRYFARQGMSAWRAGAVPYYVTSNAFIAHGYAKVAAAFADDARTRAPRCTTYVVELGAGAGYFTAACLAELVPRLPREVAVRYVMTDVAEANVLAWRTDPALAPHFESGLLSAAVFDLERDAPLALFEHLGVRDAEGAEILLFANYVFDGVRCDAFRVRGGQLCESRVRVEGELACDDAPFDALSLAYEHAPIVLPHYGRPDWDALLAQRCEGIDEADFLFPTAALACIERFRALSHDRMLLLVADRGHADVARESSSGPQPLSHGSFSLPVDFRTLALHAALHDGEATSAIHPGRALVVAAYRFGEARTRTRSALRDMIEGFGPSDFYSIKKSLERTAPLLTLEQMIAFVRLSRWDTRVIDVLRPHLEEERARGRDATRRVSAPRE